MKRLRQIESENARLKKLLAERDLEIDTALPGGGSLARKRTPSTALILASSRARRSIQA
jgi:hypothetical protein